MPDIAKVRCTCGRYVLFVAEVALAMEGDKCRHLLPESVAEPIPQEELERATIGGEKCSEMPINVVRLFRGDHWNCTSLQWAADQINTAVNKTKETSNG